MATAERLLIPRQSSGSGGHSRNDLGLLNGVYVPCLLTILGVVLFIRIGWGVAQAGWAGAMGMFALGETLSVLTVLSMATLVSNGKIRGGGSYFMISRCLGPELGGAVGLTFYLAYAFSTSLFVLGLAGNVMDAFFPHVEESKYGYQVVISSVSLLFVFFVSYLGAGFFSKINVLIFLLQSLAILVGLASMFFRQPSEPFTPLENGGFFLGWSWETLKNNTWSDYTSDDKCGGGHCSFRGVFSILYPACTGIMEGANLSGDLKDPNRDIGRGTLYAVATAITTYFFLIIAFAGSFPRETLAINMNAMANVTWPSKYIITMGVFVCAVSSALGAMFGGSRVLQALGRDDLPPGIGISFFRKGSAHGDEPRRAVVFTWAVAQCGCLIGNLDLISPIITCFFLISYSCVNLTCFLMDVSGTPNFRPQFQYHSRAQSLFGFILGVALLFYLQVWFAVASLWLILLLVVWIGYKAPSKGWGDISQSIIYHQVRKYLLRLDLDSSSLHLKHWRPSVLLLLGPGKLNVHLLQFCNTLKKGGLYCVGNMVISGDNLQATADEYKSLRQSWLALVKEKQLKAFPEVTVARSLREGFQQLVLLSGLGGMRPNCVVLPLPSSFGPLTKLLPLERQHRASLLLREDSTHNSRLPSYSSITSLSREIAEEEDNEGSRLAAAALNAAATRSDADVIIYEHPSVFLDVVRDVSHVFQKHLLVSCNFCVEVRLHRMHSCIDVWIFGSDLTVDGTLSLQFQLAHVLHLEQNHLRIRLLNVVHEGSVDTSVQSEQLAALAAQSRLLKYSVHVVSFPRVLGSIQDLFLPGSDPQAVLHMNELLKANSLNSTRVCLMPLPELPASSQDARYVGSLGDLVTGLPPTLLVLSASKESMIPTGI